jgi:hypothetical protein
MKDEKKTALIHPSSFILHPSKGVPSLHRLHALRKASGRATQERFNQPRPPA